ncbi:MAG: phosphonopyruvate decarboxylase [Flavobacteriales bacterium]|nr:phosphonopyruvate decarboxylase [Flavobacteriales bacterium]
MINLEIVFETLKKSGVEFISGVPDTLLNDFCLGLESYWNGNHHVLAANEGNAIALAAGYHFATNTVPLVYMQNSGMGNAMNPLISLADRRVYSVPMVLLIGWRGEPKTGDWPQHQSQGELSPVLLDALGIPYKALDEDEELSISSFGWAVSEARRLSKPTALLVRKNVLARKEKAGFDDNQIYTLSREEAIKTIIDSVSEDTIFVASTGRITRELYAIRDSLGHSHEYDFLNVGAMGHALSIAAGIAAARPQRSVICLDGDASALMHMGSMPITANLGLKNLLHIVLNNGVHESVGGQESVAFTVNLNEIATNSGYYTLDNFVSDSDNMKESLELLYMNRKPSFLEVRIRKGMRNDMPILKADTIRLKKQFTTSITK